MVLLRGNVHFLLFLGVESLHFIPTQFRMASRVNECSTGFSGRSFIPLALGLIFPRWINFAVGSLQQVVGGALHCPCVHFVYNTLAVNDYQLP